MKYKVKIYVTICIIFITAAAFFVREYIAVGIVDNPTTVRKTNTRITLKHLSTSICIMFLEGYENPVDMNKIIDFTKGGKDISLIKKIDDGKICDEWGNPILLEIEDSPGMIKYTFISYGPNQRDDYGKDDDIVEMCKFAKK